MHAERWAGLVGLRPIILDNYDLPTLLSTKMTIDACIDMLPFLGRGNGFGLASLPRFWVGVMGLAWLTPIAIIFLFLVQPLAFC